MKAFLKPRPGFHQDLFYLIEGDDSDDEMAVFKLTRAAFADPFELARMTFDGIIVQVHGNVDLECAADSLGAEEHYLTLKSNSSQNRVNGTIPFHLRYQPVSSGPPHSIEIELNAPVVYSVPPMNLNELVFKETVFYRVPIGSSADKVWVDSMTFFVILLGIVLIVLTKPSKTKAD